MRNSLKRAVKERKWFLVIACRKVLVAIGYPIGYLYLVKVEVGILMAVIATGGKCVKALRKCMIIFVLYSFLNTVKLGI